jgi:signal transduction histidine kinase
MTPVTVTLVPAQVVTHSGAPYADRVRRLFVSPDRPLLITVLFWVDLAIVAVTHVVYPGISLLGLGPLLLLLLLSVLLWPLLTWRRGDGRWPVQVGFAATTGLIALADGTGTSVFLVLIIFANVSLTSGLRAAVAVTAGMSLWVGATQMLVWHKPVDSAVYQVFGVVMFAAFVLALTTAVARARDERDRADRLVGELAEAHEELRRYADRVHALAVAEERTRMARELHDSVGHYLTVIKVGLENAERFRDREPEAAWLDVRQAKDLTADTLREIRRYVRALRPPLLDGRRGSAALRELARQFQGTGLAVEVAVDGEERTLDEARELVLFRVLQESLTNALRHSEATNVSVRLGFDPYAVRLSVADDGKGAGSATFGFGLTSLTDRVLGIGGVLRADDAADGGFLVRVELPLTEPMEAAA